MGVVPGKVEPLVRNCLWGIIVDAFSYVIGLLSGFLMGIACLSGKNNGEDGDNDNNKG